MSVCLCVRRRLLIEMTVFKLHDHVALQCKHRFESVNNGRISHIFFFAIECVRSFSAVTEYDNITKIDRNDERERDCMTIVYRF